LCHMGTKIVLAKEKRSKNNGSKRRLTKRIWKGGQEAKRKKEDNNDENRRRESKVGRRGFSLVFKKIIGTFIQKNKLKFKSWRMRCFWRVLIGIYFCGDSFPFGKIFFIKIKNSKSHF
jgi:hypothetical protein